MASSGAAKRLRAGIKLQVGVLGERQTEETDENGNTHPSSSDLKALFGFAPFIEYRIVPKYFSAGLLFGFNFWKDKAMDDADLGRNIFIDIDAVLRVHYPMLKRHLEIYLAVPVGFTVSIPSEDTQDSYREEGYQFDNGYGANVSVLGGVSYRFWKGLDMFLEVGYMFHYAKHDITRIGSGKGIEQAITLHEMALNFGVSYSF